MPGRAASPRSSTTCAAVVGLTRPKRFADGAAMPAAEAVEQLERQRVRWHADPDGRPPTGDDVEHAVAAFEEHRERTRPAGGGEDARGRRDRTRPVSQLVGIGQVHDQRMAWRPALDLEDAGDSRRILGVGTEPVHGLGRHRDDATGTQPLDGHVDIGDDEPAISAVTIRSLRHQAGTASRKSSAASMNANDSGVAKWSVLRNAT